MSYIGQTLPADTFQGFTTDSFTGDGSATTFTLSKTPFNESALLVVINNVVQKPTTNFTVSGTTLTIVGTAVASGDVIYATHIGGALPIGGAAELDLNGASDKLILDADADTTISADTDDQIDFKAGGTDVMSMTATGLTINDGTIITTADNTDTLRLISTDADANVGPVLVLHRDSASPADNDVLGNIIFAGEDSAGNETDFLRLDVQASDKTNGAEDVQLRIMGMLASAETEFIRLNPNGFIFNEGGGNLNFRIESSGNANMIFVDGGNDAVIIGAGSNTSPSTSSTATHSCFKAGGGILELSASSNPCILTNRVNSEGSTVEFRQAGGLRGSISVGGASTAFNTSSDYRLKENVNYTWDGTTILKQLKPAEFNWKVDPDNTVHGFIAHEAKTVVPDSIIGEKDAVDENGDIAPQQIDQSKLVPLLVKTVQELEARIKTLEDA